MGGRQLVRWSEIGGRVTMSERRGVAMPARVEIALCWYLGFLFLSEDSSKTG